MKTFNSPANRAFARALAAGSNSEYGLRQLELAVSTMQANSEDGVVDLPADIAGHLVLSNLATDSAGGEGKVRFSNMKLPMKLVREARERQADFEKRNKRRGPARTGKTGRKGGRAAAERRKRERSAKDRALRDSMRGSSTKGKKS